MSDEEPNSNMYQDILVISKRKINNPNKKSAKHLNRHFKKEDIQKDDSSGKGQIKNTMRYRYTANGVAKSETMVNATAGKNEDQLELSYTAGGQIITALWETAVSSRAKYVSTQCSSNSTSQEK